MPEGKPTGHKGGAVPPKGGMIQKSSGKSEAFSAVCRRKENVPQKLGHTVYVHGVTYILYVSRSNCQFVLDAQKEIVARINPSDCFHSYT